MLASQSASSRPRPAQRAPTPPAWSLLASSIACPGESLGGCSAAAAAGMTDWQVVLSPRACIQPARPHLWQIACPRLPPLIDAVPLATTALVALRLRAVWVASIPTWARALAATAPSAALTSPTLGSPQRRARPCVQCPMWTPNACTIPMVWSMTPRLGPACLAGQAHSAPQPTTPCLAWPGEQSQWPSACLSACLHASWLTGWLAC